MTTCSFCGGDCGQCGGTFDGYSKISCHDCSGHGLVPHYSFRDFEDAKECSTCEGTGHLYITPNKRLVVWPGGPFKGRV